MYNLIINNPRRDAIAALNNYMDYFYSRSCFDKNRTAVDETETEVIIKLEVPGFSKDDISVKVSSENVLTVSGELKNGDCSEADETTSSSSASSSCSFTKSFGVEGIDTEKINAQCKNGILTITCPKIMPEPPKVVDVTIE